MTDEQRGWQLARITPKSGFELAPALHCSAHAMPSPKTPENLAPLHGRWRIHHMSTWGEDYRDMEVEAYIEINEDRSGRFQFGLVVGHIDWRRTRRGGKPAIAFSWAGNDENDEVSGRGWAVLESPTELRGRIYIHMGDDSSFRARRLGG